MNEDIFRTGPPAWSLRVADRVDGPGVPGASPGGGDLQAAWGGASSPGRSTSLPLTKTAPARTRATRCGALTARHRSWRDSISLKPMATAAAREPGPLVILVRCLTVANLDSIGLVVHRWTQCSAG